MLQALSRRFADVGQLSLVLGTSLKTSDDLLTRLQTLGLRRITRCRLTRNRNVMVSFGGDELRVHEGYLRAPDDVLSAIVRFVEGATRTERLRARRHLLDFPIEMRDSVRRRE